MTLTIDLSAPDLSFRSGHLRMGGANPNGVEIAANSRFLTLGGQPWLPVMGEFHFSRYACAGWRDELLKLKAGGIGVVATYIFWNHHEQVEGCRDWSGERDLRRFVTLCGELGLYSFPRLGPWAHGEARLGGFPDWLVSRCPRTRQDDPAYLGYVRGWYGAIAEQLRGLLWKQGGPVIGVQLENELSDQTGHIATLKCLAREAGIDVPLYTMTGWGPCQVPEDEVIPVFGGYPDAPWDRQVDGWARASRKHYFFSAIRDDNTIGADLRPATWAPDLDYLGRYPYGTCELGGGVQVTYHRRPLIAPQDVSAMALCKLGSGANLLGYYMAHGGTQPLGAHSTLQESQETGYWNDVPVRSYDFQAPLGEAGQIREHYHRLRRLHLFLQDFGGGLAPLPALFPHEQPAGLDDTHTLRWSARSDGRRGFVFVNNYQRIDGLPAQPEVQFELRLAAENLCFPAQPVDLPAGLEAIWPFHLDLNGVDLRYATAQPLCRLAGEDVPVYVFFASSGVRAEFAFEPEALVIGWRGEHLTTETQRTQREEEKFSGKDVVALSLPPFDSPSGVRSAMGARPLLPPLRSGVGGIQVPLVPSSGVYSLTPGSDHIYDLLRGDQPIARILLLTPAESLQCWKVTTAGRERIVLSAATLLCDGERLRLRAERQEQAESKHPEPAYRRLQAAGPARTVPLGAAGVAQAPGGADFDAAEVWQVDFPAGLLDGAVEARLVVDYVGDAARAYLGDELVADDFYYGRPWEIGLSCLGPAVLAQGLTLRFLPLRRDAPLYLPGDWRAAMEGDSVLEVRGMRVEFEVEVQFEMG
jgi:beta-galactosidase